MKHTFKTLLGLVLVVFVLAGCSNPAGPETPEVNEPPVVETPEENIKLTKVEFRWGTEPEVGDIVNLFESYNPLYLLDLHFDQELKDYFYGFPEGYDLESYIELLKDTKRFKKFSDDAFETVFGTKYYEEGTVIDLKKWTSHRATDLIDKYIATRLQFSTTDTNKTDVPIVKDPFDEIVVGNEDIIVYVFWDSEESKYSTF